LELKLAGYDLCGALLHILTDFLHNRTQKVVLPHGESQFLPVLSGVPQGSVLVPINDVVDIFSDCDVHVKLYADDIKIYLEINSDTDSDTLQQCIDNISVWASTWQLNLARNKCQNVRFGLSRSVPNYTYSVENIDLTSEQKVRDLGVIIDSRLCFSEHIDSVVCKGHQRANQILRCFLSKDPDILMKAFITYVRPILEYCSPVWSPCYVGLINKLETVQRRFTKRLTGLYLLSYDERCKRLGIERLELRRLHADLIMCYKIIHGHVALCSDDFFDIVSASSTRGHPYKLFVPDSRIDCRKHFFAVKIVKIWNSLPENIVCLSHLTAFISAVKCSDLRKFIIGKI